MSKEYCLGLTNAQALMNKLKNASHMMTSSNSGTFYSKIAPALLSCLTSNGVNGFTAAYCPTNSPGDLVTALKGGKDVIMLIGWCGTFYTTNMGMAVSNYGRVGGHIVVATGATMGTNGDTSIDFQDDALGGDNQNDNKPDRAGLITVARRPERDVERPIAIRDGRLHPLARWRRRLAAADGATGNAKRERLGPDQRLPARPGGMWGV